MMETLAMPCAADFECIPCDPAPWSGPAARMAETTMPQMAAKILDNKPEPRSGSATSSTTRSLKDGGISARERRQAHYERGVVTDLTLPEDVTIGNGHRSSASVVNANI